MNNQNLNDFDLWRDDNILDLHYDYTVAQLRVLQTFDDYCWDRYQDALDEASY